MTLKEKFIWLESALGGYGWAIQILIVMLIVMVLCAIERRVFRELKTKLKKTTSLWDDAIATSLHRPLYTLIWVLGVSFCGKIISNQVNHPIILDLIRPAKKIAVVSLFVWFLLGLIRAIEAKLLATANEKEDADITLITAVGQLMRTSAVITAFLLFLQTFGMSLSAVIAFGGVGGMAVAFAAKDLLSNFFGGLMIFLDRPFAIGEWIRSPDKSIEGVVEHIGWRLTRIRTFEKRPLYVPNSLFLTISIENPSRMKNRRIKTSVGVRYDDASKVRAIVEDIRLMLIEDPEIDQRQTIIVNFNQFAPSSMDILIYCFTVTTNFVRFHKVKQEVYLKIVEVIEKHGAECAFPTTTMHLHDGDNLSEKAKFFPFAGSKLEKEPQT